MSTLNDVIRYTEIVDVSPDFAFRVFVDHFNEWWPSTCTFAQRDLQYIGIEPGVAGRCLERDGQGNEVVWGEVLVWEPPERIAFSWWIQPDRTIDRDRASEIEVRFIDERVLTRVEFQHRHLSRHGDGWEMMRQAMASREGWSMNLQLYADFTNG